MMSQRPDIIGQAVLTHLAQSGQWMTIDELADGVAHVVSPGYAIRIYESTAHPNTDVENATYEYKVYFGSRRLIRNRLTALLASEKVEKRGQRPGIEYRVTEKGAASAALFVADDEQHEELHEELPEALPEEAHATYEPELELELEPEPKPKPDPAVDELRASIRDLAQEVAALTELRTELIEITSVSRELAKALRGLASDMRAVKNAVAKMPVAPAAHAPAPAPASAPAHQAHAPSPNGASMGRPVPLPSASLSSSQTPPQQHHGDRKQRLPRRRPKRPVVDT